MQLVLHVTGCGDIGEWAEEERGPGGYGGGDFLGYIANGFDLPVRADRSSADDAGGGIEGVVGQDSHRG